LISAERRPKQAPAERCTFGHCRRLRHTSFSAKLTSCYFKQSIHTQLVLVLLSPLSAAGVQGAAKKSGLLKFFAVFSATVRDFDWKFYSFLSEIFYS